jgi:PA14 domain-containing protein
MLRSWFIWSISLVTYSLLLLYSQDNSLKTPTSDPTCFPRQTVPLDRWRGEYFNNRALEGTPVMVRDDGVGEIDFDWGLLSPAKECGLNVDQFSVRWTRTVAFAGRTYRFNIASDDGVRLLIDGQERFSSWQTRPFTTNTLDLEMSAGNHKIELDFFENFGSASVKLSWTPAPCTAVVLAERWKAEYFNNQDLSGKPALVRDEGDGQLGYFWGLKSPDSSCNIGVDNFSVRWSRTVTFAEGLYHFTVTSYDKVRIYIDRELRFEGTADQKAVFTFDLPVAAGNHEIIVEYFERTGDAGLMVEWERHYCFPEVPTDHWRGEYFNNKSLSGPTLMIRDMGDGVLNFDSGAISPNDSKCNVNANDFSVRWSRKIILTGGMYRFTVTGDDGVRLYVNGKRLINQWRDQKRATYYRDLLLPAGRHQLMLEYYNHTGEGVARLSWQEVGLSQNR